MMIQSRCRLFVKTTSDFQRCSLLHSYRKLHWYICVGKSECFHSNHGCSLLSKGSNLLVFLRFTMKYSTLFCLCLVALGSSATQFEDCGSTASAVTLDFEGCVSPPCFVERGQSYLANVGFTATKDADTVTNKITANIGGLETPWPGLDKDGCNNLAAGGSPCPVVSGGNYKWFMDVDILSDYPTITTLATIQFLGDDMLPIVCMKVPVTIT